MRASIQQFAGRYPWAALVVGALSCLSFAPYNLWPLAILCTAYLFLAWHGASPARAAQAGFAYTAGTYLAGTYWLYHSIYGIGHAPLWLTLVAMLGLVAIMASYTAAVGYALARWVRGDDALRWLLILPATMVLLEWFRGWFLSGFPWLALGYSHLDTVLAGLAPIGGVYSVSFAVALSAGAVVTLLLATARSRWVAAGALAAVWLVAYAFWGRAWTAPAGQSVTVAIVQGAVPQEMKWNQAQFEDTLKLYRELSQPHLGAKIIVWPESALAAPAHLLSDYLIARWSEARRSGSSLVLGQLRRDPRREVYYNAVLALDDEPQWYAKRRLVPLSEYFPVPEFVRDWLKGLDLPYSGFEAGAAAQSALSAGGQKLGASVCYEDAYASDQLAVLKEATLLVNVTNDAWFGDSTAAYQHLQISRMRALEAGRVLLRAANDGVSAIIGADGAVLDALPRFKPGVLAGTVQPRLGLTPYAKLGNWPVVSLSLMVLIGGLLRRAPVRVADSLPASAKT